MRTVHLRDPYSGLLGRYPDGGHEQRRPALALTHFNRVGRREVPRLGDTHDYSSNRSMPGGHQSAALPLPSQTYPSTTTILKGPRADAPRKHGNSRR